MPLWGILLTLFATFIMFAFVHYIAKNKRPFKRALISMSVGAALLFLIHFSYPLTGVNIPISLLSILTSVIGGVPGVTLLLFLNLFF